MKTHRLRSWLVAGGAWLVSLPVLASGSSSGGLSAFVPCRIPDAAHLSVVTAECATLQVPENPQAPHGRHISLHIARIPAISLRKAPDPLFLLAGGPGMAASTLYAGVAPAFARIHRDRDIVLVDQRGTGGSHRLNCPYDEERLLHATSAEVEELTGACLDALSRDSDVRFYTTSVAVRDLDRVRAALGYERINLYASSYGTRVAEHYLRRFPGRTRTMILDGVIPPQLALGPEIATAAQKALDGIFARCARDAGCSKGFGNLQDTYDALRDSLRSRARQIDFVDPTTGEPMHMRFGMPHLATVLRLSTYTSEQAALLPLMLHTAQASGNFAPLAGEFLLMLRVYADVLAYGMHNSVVCTEDVPFYDPEKVDRAQLARTFLGTTQLDALISLCKRWPQGLLDADLHEPLHSDVPTLLLSGGNDPVTPPAYAERARAGLTRSLHIVLKGEGHGQLTAPCMDRVMAEFVERGSVAGLDISCTRRVKPMPFFLSLAGPAP